MSAHRDAPQFSKQLTIIVGLTVVGFMAFGLTLSFYRNIVFEETLKTIEGGNRDIAKGIEKGYAELEYFRSDQFKDKFAKENLSRVNPGERLLVITHHDPAPVADGRESMSEIERRETAYMELLRQMPVLEHWQLYLFQRDRIETLRRSQ